MKFVDVTIPWPLHIWMLLKPNSISHSKQIDNWRILDQMVKTSLNEFQEMWRKRAKERRTVLDWATTDKGKTRKKKVTDEEALSPGSVVKVALGEKFKSLNIYVTSFGKSDFHPNLKSTKTTWQHKLCKVLVDVCLNGTSKVNPFAVKKTSNNLVYLKLEIHGNPVFVKRILEGRELGFEIRIQMYNRQSATKHYAINLQSKRFGRSPPGSGNKEVPGADYDMPDYDQHKCCGDCWSGCSPVAWAQVFGYYDRRASSSSSIFSPKIYGHSYEKAPKTLTNKVKYFVEDIRRQVKTFCRNGKGSTYARKMRRIKPWFKDRQGKKARVRSYLWPRKAKWLRSKGKWWLDIGYPVVFGFRSSKKSGHSVVATKYRTKTRYYRHCKKKWWRKIRCTWKTAQDYEFFLHYGWGGRNNQWQMLDPTSAHVAYIRKWQLVYAFKNETVPESSLA